MDGLDTLDRPIRPIGLIRPLIILIRPPIRPIRPLIRLIRPPIRQIRPQIIPLIRPTRPLLIRCLETTN